MKVNYKILILLLIAIGALTTTVDYYKSPRNIGLPEEFANERVKQVLMDTTRRAWQFGWNGVTLIKTKEAAISIAEPILFEIYGREQILSERPYGTYKIGDYWFLSGSLARRWDNGGGFEIIIDSRDAKVMSIVHYK